MQIRPEQPERDVWFRYSRRPGKISATPANAKGWVALAGCIGATILVGRALSGWAFSVHPGLGFAALMGVITTGVLLTVGLAVAKGQEVN